MDNNSTILFVFFFNRTVNTFQEIFRGQQNYTIIDKFNTNCKEDQECQDITLYCNLTSSLCQCATFFFRNEIDGICEFQQDDFAHRFNRTIESWDTTNSTFDAYRYRLPLSATCVWIFGVICMFSCVVYVCLGNENKNNGSEVLSKKQKESNQIEMHQ